MKEYGERFKGAKEAFESLGELPEDESELRKKLGYEFQKNYDDAVAHAETSFRIKYKRRRSVLKSVTGRSKEEKEMLLPYVNYTNLELHRAKFIFETVGMVKEVKFDSSLLSAVEMSAYDPKTGAIVLPSDYGFLTMQEWIQSQKPGWFSTDSPLHVIRHEIGHALYYFYMFETKENKKDVAQRLAKLRGLHRKYFSEAKEEDGTTLLSRYAEKGYREMFAEAVAEIMNGNPREFARNVVTTVIGTTLQW